MQYRVQSSVTEERLVRPSTQDPPKSYTPLSALSCMLPPGSGDSIGEFFFFYINFVVLSLDFIVNFSNIFTLFVLKFGVSTPNDKKS